MGVNVCPICSKRDCSWLIHCDKPQLLGHREAQALAKFIVDNQVGDSALAFKFAEYILKFQYPTKVCDSISTWADLMSDAKDDRGLTHDRFNDSWREIRLGIEKSCLLDRMIYNGEKPSRTKCPVHRGIWAGCHVGWPGTFWTNVKTGEKTPVEPDAYLQKWYDDGCRCYQHSCGCTTGWNPDEHCGCLKKETT